MKILKITNPIIIGLVFFIIGGGLGFTLGFQQILTQKLTDPLPLSSISELTKQEKTIRELLASKKVDTICVNIIGEVVRVGEDNITINHNGYYPEAEAEPVIKQGFQLELKVNPGVHISRSIPPIELGGESRMEIIELNQIQPKEQANIYAIFSKEGEIVVQRIAVH